MARWARYVPVAERRARSRRDMGKLKQKGRHIQPVEIEGRTIARSFWGKGWCDHLESFSDFANRLPRGRRYVRNGSVCHLEIRPGRVEAIVSGSEFYDVSIQIAQLKAATWKSIKAKCAGQVGSMLELLQGRLSRDVMGVVAERDHGLFPKPREIALDCTCPDWATMCKHVAAALYGVGHRLDQQPDLLFLLRDVDAADLIATDMALPEHEVTGEVLEGFPELESPPHRRAARAAASRSARAPGWARPPASGPPTRRASATPRPSGPPRRAATAPPPPAGRPRPASAPETPPPPSAAPRHAPPGPRPAPTHRRTLTRPSAAHRDRIRPAAARRPSPVSSARP